jgi:hypothetical protein
MVKQKSSINLFDVFVIFVIIVIVFIGIFFYTNRPVLGKKNVLIEVMISDPTTIKTSLSEVQTDLGREVYYSGTKYPVKQVSYRTEKDASGQLKYLYITIEGLGTISYGDSIFNGQRVYTNQKVEIHADYQVQGYVTDFRYEN